MLSRSPIRKKLLLALAILTAMVATLAFSGFWGLYRYRHLANSVSQRALEIPQTHSLLRSAEAMRDSCHQVETVLLQRSPIGPERLLSRSLLASESDRFDDALHEFSWGLSRYQVSLDTPRHPPRSGLLYIDPSKQQQLLADIEHSLEEVKQNHRRSLKDLDPIDFAGLQLALDGLYEHTVKLPAFLQERMAVVREEAHGEYRTWIAVAWLCTILALLMLGTLLWLFRTLVMQPFRTLLEGCRLVASGEFSHHIDLGTGDELDELAHAMNGMTDRFQKTCTELEALCEDLDRQVRERTREVIQREQLASVGFLAAGVAHEINNPLAAIAWSAEAVEARLFDVLHGNCDEGRISRDDLDSLKNNLTRIQSEAFRCKGITERLLDFSRLGNVTVEPTDLRALIEDVVSMVKTLGQYRCKTISFESSAEVTTEVNAQEIRQVVLNLLTNALESVASDGEVRVELMQTATHAQIAVSDNGCGMTDEVRENLFEPFFTRRQDGRGTGLGLSITYRIICKHGGMISAHSDGVGQGSRLEVFLPCQSKEMEDATSKVA